MSKADPQIVAGRAGEVKRTLPSRYPAEVHASQLAAGDTLTVRRLEQPVSWELLITRPRLDGSYYVLQCLYVSRSGERCTREARRRGWRGNGRPPATLPPWPEVGQVEPQ